MTCLLHLLDGMCSGCPLILTVSQAGFKYVNGLGMSCLVLGMPKLDVGLLVQSQGCWLEGNNPFSCYLAANQPCPYLALFSASWTQLQPVNFTFLQSTSLASGCQTEGFSLLATEFLLCHWCTAAELFEANVRLISSLEVWQKSSTALKAVDHSPKLSNFWWINPLTHMVDDSCLPGCSVISPVLALKLCIKNVSFFCSVWWTKKTQ